jgi:uncharacterized protein YndB with AHSA1/START domain
VGVPRAAIAKRLIDEPLLAMRLQFLVDGFPVVPHLFGEFREIEPVARLAYTFRYEPPDPDDRDTVVVLSFGDLGEATAVTVEQGTFATKDRRALHEQGWAESLDRLEELLRSRDWSVPPDG